MGEAEKIAQPADLERRLATGNIYTQRIGALRKIAAGSGERTQGLSIHGMKTEPRNRKGYASTVICQGIQKHTITEVSGRVGEALIWRWTEKTITSHTRQKIVS